MAHIIDRSYIELEHLGCGCREEKIDKAAREMRDAIVEISRRWDLCGVGSRRALTQCMVRNTSDDLDEISLTASVALQVLDDLDRRLAVLTHTDPPRGPNVSDVGSA